tara:strand:+ start:280 stop:1365 length:1086 start_codon:yes stop_codon:yes gene_type:complete
MVKRGTPVAPSSIMRHLSVPSRETQSILCQLKAAAALPEGARVRADPTDETRRLIPVIDSATVDLLTHYPVIHVDSPPPSPRSYRDHLNTILSQEIIESVDWPTRHEFVGDLILIKLDSSQREYGDAIGQALLNQHKRTRAVFEDKGVTGDFRVRDLNLLAVREGFSPTTRTKIVESGQELWTDPSSVYYSSRLSHEREGTLECAKRIREHLGRPISVCDPYAGVGPSLLPLVKESGLLGESFAGDLNPKAVEFLHENIGTDKFTIECVDARTLQSTDSLREKFDLLLVNIPHDAIEHTPDLLPLLRDGGVVRGWAIIEDEDFEAATNSLTKSLGKDVEIEVRRSYSATANLCRFESQINR